MKNRQIIWQPEGDYLKSRVSEFANEFGMDPTGWKQLIDKSTEDIEWFWDSFLKFADMQWSKPYSQLLDQSEGLPWTKWFIGGRTNIAYNCLDWHLSRQSNLELPHQKQPQSARKKVGSDHSALIWENESGQSRHLTYGELNTSAGQVATLLTQLGVQNGDAIGIYMPMIPEVLSVLFACFKIGAVAVPVFSGFGPEALLNRMLDARVKVIFTADGGRRRGKLLNIKTDVDQMRDSLPSLKHVVVVKYTGSNVNWLQPASNHSGDVWFDEAIKDLPPAGTNYDLPAEHPCLYLYTSGTTGKAKGTIHTHAGAMAQIAKELGMVFDVSNRNRFFWLTDIGWMMGPWEMIGVTYWGGTLVMYDGAPDYPQPDRLWQLVAQHKINTLGVSPTVIRILKAESNHLIEQHDLSSLRFLGSTGEPWDDETYMWLFNKIGGKRCPIMNISGGTELIGCLLAPLPTMPLPACSLGSKGLAMDVDVFDDSGNSLVNSIGHLVLKKAVPSLTKGFLGDSQRWLEIYFSKYKNIWYHGDWAMQDDRGYWYLYGRSDDTIKLAGKRIGPGEIESALIEHPAVKEAAAIGVPDELKGEALVCFIVLNQAEVAARQTRAGSHPPLQPHKSNASLPTSLRQEISQHLVSKLGALARPKHLHFVESLPKTRSGKIVRAAIRKQYLGETIENINAIENPESLNGIIKAPD